MLDDMQVTIKRKIAEEIELVTKIETKKLCQNNNATASPSQTNITETKNTVTHQSPRKRLQLDSGKRSPKKDRNNRFIYGNYSQYYTHRRKDFKDVRLTLFDSHQNLFVNKEILDIGCNSGYITMEVAKRFQVRRIVGIDIDRKLVEQANAQLVEQKKSLPWVNDARLKQMFPYNVKFIYGNYVLKDDVLLEIERPQFDVILALSITKWIQLNFGDKGLKQAFRRMFLQLRAGGVLILEPQSANYNRRKNLTETIKRHYQTMELFPKQYPDYLLSDDIGFSSMELLGTPDTTQIGFKRPIYMFKK